ncbi:hypothetical protein [Paenibacillus odorifer]|uniref:hypothetical protein n=1 Tax=Paenibacillus odorifer TaxID=189426 RepID=UPI00096D688A|nr:hypothetical protein [Paenibacillus odorifer]OMD66773.1 hypothetical protein BSK50_30620 [Paenibacillus odorifer]
MNHALMSEIAERFLNIKRKQFKSLGDEEEDLFILLSDPKKELFCIKKDKENLNLYIDAAQEKKYDVRTFSSLNAIRAAVSELTKKGFNKFSILKV